MKNLCVILVSILLISCIQLPNGGNGNNNQRIKAKVIRITCATTVIQILDAVHYNLGETWNMQGTSTTYKHAAVVSNKCEFPNSIQEGDEFYFNIIVEDEARNDCVVCMIYDYPPSKGIFMRVLN